MPAAVAATRGAQHPGAVAPSAARSAATAARYRRVRLPDAHEEVDGSERSPERDGAPASRGGRSEGWTTFAIPTGTP